MKPSSVEAAVLDALDRHRIRTLLTVPCKYIAPLIRRAESDPRFTLLYPAREEEGLGIAAGVHLGGARAALLIQNSGLGNLVNAQYSLNRFYDIPACFLVSHRGDEFERVPAQVPMGQATRDLLGMMGFEVRELHREEDLPLFESGLGLLGEGRSVAFLFKKSFWAGRA